MQLGTCEQTRVLIFSYYSVLVNAVNNNVTQGLPSWEATPTIAMCARLILELSEWVTVQHVGREALTGPHRLANWARTSKQRGPQIHLSTAITKSQLAQNMDTQFFQLQQTI